jgi:hypothetical protein
MNVNGRHGIFWHGRYLARLNRPAWCPWDSAWCLSNEFWLLDPEDWILNSAILRKPFFIIQKFKPKMSYRWYSTRKRTSEWFTFTYLYSDTFCKWQAAGSFKNVIDGSGHNTQTFGYLYSMVCLHYQNSSNYTRGRNGRDHSCQHCKVDLRWQNKCHHSFFPTIACKNNETFHVLAILKYVASSLPPWSMLEKVGLIFSFQSFTQHWIGCEGGIYAVLSIIFAPDCLYLYFWMKRNSFMLIQLIAPGKTLTWISCLMNLLQYNIFSQRFSITEYFM